MNRCKTLALAIALAMAPSGLAPLFAQEAPKFFFEGDLVRSGLGTPQGTPCVLNSRFKRGEVVIFRVRLLDAKTGKPLDATAVKSMQVQLSNGETATITYKQHPPAPKAAEDYYWTGGWMVSDSQPTGSFTYKVVVTDLDGKTTTWSPFKTTSSQLTIVEK